MIFKNESSRHVAILWLYEHEEEARALYNEICDRDYEGRGKIFDLNDLVWELDGKDIFELIKIGQLSPKFDKEAKYFCLFKDDMGTTIGSYEELKTAMALSYGEMVDRTDKEDLPPSLVKIVKLWEE